MPHPPLHPIPRTLLNLDLARVFFALILWMSLCRLVILLQVLLCSTRILVQLLSCPLSCPLLLLLLPF